jgi:uncharacterized protein YicC (UPF0701 family)
MDQHEFETRIKNIDARTTRIEQILPTLATKEDLKACATKEDLKACATKEDLKAYATKEDLKAYATKEDVREEGTRTRLHFDLVADGIKESIKAIADGYKALDDRITNLSREIKSVLGNHEHRITRLEADSSKRR